MAIRLNETSLLSTVFNSVPAGSIELVARSIPSNYVERFVSFLSKEMEASTQLELGLRWTSSLLLSHGEYLLEENQVLNSFNAIRTSSANKLSSALRALLRVINARYESLTKICNENTYALQFLASFGNTKARVNVHSNTESINVMQDQKMKDEQNSTVYIDKKRKLLESNEEDAKPAKKARVK